MNLSDLIQQLEKADALATGVRVTSLDAMSRLSGEVTAVRSDRRVASAVSRDDAQAIAILLNASPDVLQALLDLRTHRHWHEESIKLQGPEPGRTPSMVNAWIRNLMSRLDASEARLKEFEDSLFIEDEFGDPLENAMDRIKELLSMFNCQSCYDKRWVVGVEGAWPGGGDPGNECQIPCPDCQPPLPTDEATS